MFIVIDRMWLFGTKYFFAVHDQFGIKYCRSKLYSDYEDCQRDAITLKGKNGWYITSEWDKGETDD